MNRLEEARRLVVKVGSALLVDDAGAVNLKWLDALSADLSGFARRGCAVTVVTSGAVAIGRNHLGLPAGPLRLEEKQAAAAVGQIRLAHAYQEALANHGLKVAQVLLTPTDSENRRRYLNARNTLQTLLSLGVAPVVNENDTVATAEIRFGDNDRLAARVAQMIGADALVLLSDIDGLYSADPRTDKNAVFIPEVRELTEDIVDAAGDPGSCYGSGGMVTKLQAARIALGAGCKMAIAPGKGLHPLKAMTEGGRCTWFLTEQEPLTARKRWISGQLTPQGRIIVDDGACKALKKGGSLLPAGVVLIEGDFQRGDAVLVADKQGRPAARGLIGYSARDARLIIGHKSADIESILGYRHHDELIHRDDMVLEG